MLNKRFRHGFALSALLIAPMALVGQAAVNQLGTVKTVAGSTITLTPASGADVTITVSPDAPVLQLPPGSKSLQAATPAKLEDVSVGDRILATGKAGDAAGTLTASRIVLMKSNDIAARNAAEQREWQRNGLGGLVKSVDGPVVTVVSGAKVLKIATTPTTDFKRYASDSVAFTDTKPGTLADVHAGDQLRARGTVADDKLSMTAVAVVSGSFENLSGVISAIDPAAQSLTLKDLTTKKNVTVMITSKSDLRVLPAQAAAAFAARTAGAGAAHPAGAPGAGTPPANAGATPAATGAGATPHARSAGHGSLGDALAIAYPVAIRSQDRSGGDDRRVGRINRQSHCHYLAVRRRRHSLRDSQRLAANHAFALEHRRWRRRSGWSRCRRRWSLRNIGNVSTSFFVALSILNRLP